MGRLVASRLAGLVVVLWALVTIVFFTQSVIPSDPARLIAGPSAPPSVVEEKRQEMHLDDPLLQQYVRYLGNAVQGDLGVSISTHRPVVDDLGRAIPASLELLIAAMAMTVAIGIGIGILSARRSHLSGLLRVLLCAGASVPSFFVGILALLLLYHEWHLIPGSGRLSANIAPPNGPTGFYTVDGLVNLRPEVTLDALWHLLAPAFCLAIGPSLVVARTLRSSILSQHEADYVRTAHAKGLRGRQIMLRHVLRNAMNAPLSILGLEVGAMLAGIVVVESVFSWPGLGLYTSQAIVATDFPAIAGVSLFVGTVYILSNAVVDVLQVFVDPRLRSRAA